MNPYEVLEVPEDAPQSDIERAYRRLARTHHPDHNPDDPQASERFKQVVNAFAAIGNPESRAEYHGQPQVLWRRNGKPFTSTTDDFFRKFFRNQRKKSVPTVIEVPVTLEQVFAGDEFDVTFDRNDVCQSCDGKGGVVEKCKVCDGAGSRPREVRPGELHLYCDACDGRGVKLVSRCENCQAGISGKSTFTVKFVLPPGVEDDSVFIYPGMGHPDPSQPGVFFDLHFWVKVQPHPEFKRLPDGGLLIKKRLSYPRMTLGTRLEFKTLDDTLTVTIPELTKPGSKFRLKGRGLPISNKGRDIYLRGDLTLVVELDMPCRLSRRQRELLLELCEIETQDEPDADSDGASS